MPGGDVDWTSGPGQEPGRMVILVLLFSVQPVPPVRLWPSPILNDPHVP